MKTKYTIILIVLVCLMQLLGANKVYANFVSNERYVIALTDSTLSGSTSVNYQSFFVEDYWNINDASLNLVYKISTLTISSLSSITIHVNDTPLYSVRPEATSVEQQLTINIPVEIIKKGTNNVRFTVDNKTNVNSSYVNVCQSDDSFASWFNLLEESSITINYNKTALTESISSFYERFLGIDTLDQNLHAIAIPQNANAIELEASVYTLSGMTKANRLNNVKIPIVTESDKSLNSKELIIFVSNYEHLQNQFKSELNENYDLDNNAIIKIFNTNGKVKLIVTSKNNELLLRASKFISNGELMTQVSQSEKLINKDTHIDSPIIESDKFVKFSTNGNKLTGPKHQEISYFIGQAGNKKLAESTKIKLDMSYAKNLDFSRSLVTVSINDYPIGSKKLTEELANGDSLELAIPQNLNINGNFSVKVEYDLEMDNSNCIIPSQETPWAYIHNSSILQINSVDRFDLIFTSYPTPFLTNGTYNEVAVILPYELDSNTYRTITNVFNLLGKYSNSNLGDIDFYNDSVEHDEIRNKNIIVIGSYKTNKFIREFNKNLYFQFSSNGETFLSNDKKSIESVYGTKVGTLQLMSSPFSSNHAMLVISGASSKQYEAASELISNDQTLWQIFGDAVLIDHENQLFSYRFKIEDIPIENVFDNIFERTDIINFSVGLLLTLILTILSFILLLRKYWRKRREK